MQKSQVRYAAIINPIAGGGRALRGWRALREIIHRTGELEEYYTEYPGHATEVARVLTRKSYTMAIAVGGDGTIHEVINGLMEENGDGHYVGPLFATLPLGRGNDFARTFQLAMDPGEAWAYQTNGRVKGRLIDIGRVEPDQGAGSYFVNMCGAGFDADSAAVANRLPRGLGGALPYVVGVLVNFIRLRNRALEVRLRGAERVSAFSPPGWAPAGPDLDGNLVLSDAFLLTSIGIGKYLGGGMMLLPHADPTDGMLDVMVARRVGRARLLRILPGIFRGEHLGEPEVSYYRAREVEILAPENTHIHADGDPVGTGGATVRVIPKVLPVAF